MRRAAVTVLFGALATGFLFATNAHAGGCAAQNFGGISVRIDDDRLVAGAGGKVLAQQPLPVVGSAWRCLDMRAFPDHRLLFVEWHQGAAGTSQIFHRISLLAFSVDERGIRARGNWTLSQGYQGKGPDIIEVAQTYRLERREWGIEVVLEGTRRITIEPE